MNLSASTQEARQNPVGIFDSGIGGLTVAAQVRLLLPSETILYVGDTARVPYGTKSPSTVTRYSQEISRLLLDNQAKAIVVACNTASALALETLRTAVPVPVLGVIEPGARAAVQASRNGRIGVIGTRGTIASRAYDEAIHRLSPDARIYSRACPLLVPVIEEGMFQDPITDQILSRYLQPLLAEGVDTLVLGCTHYPLLKKAIQRIAGLGVTLVDSAENCAAALQTVLEERALRADAQQGSLAVSLTDRTEAFLRVAERELQLQIDSVDHVSLGEG